MSELKKTLIQKTKYALKHVRADHKFGRCEWEIYNGIEDEMRDISIKRAENGYYYCQITIPYFARKYKLHEIIVSQKLSNFAARNGLVIKTPLKNKTFWYFHWDE